MSRVAKKPVEIISGVDVKLNGNVVTIKGSKGELSLDVHDSVKVEQEGNLLTVAPLNAAKTGYAMAGTMRSLLNNMVMGVSQGFEKKLTLIGVGYRGAVQGKKVNLNLGYSNPIDFDIPEGVTITAPSQTELVITGADKQQVGEVAAKIRSFRPPEPYKGKGVRYSDEQVKLKEAKKK